MRVPFTASKSIDLMTVKARRRGRYLHNKHNRRTSMTSAGFEPAILAGKRRQAYALNRTATGIGTQQFFGATVR